MPRWSLSKLRHVLLLLLSCMLLLLWCMQSTPEITKLSLQPSLLADVGRLIWAERGNASLFAPHLDMGSEVMNLSPVNSQTGDQQLTQKQVADRLSVRRAVLQRACMLYRNSSVAWRHAASFLHIEQLNVSFCPIQKCGSTTWKGLFAAIRKSLSSAHRPVPASSLDRTQQLDQALMFVFVREPYSRLLSAYVDKLMSPNTMYWAITGRYIVSHFRSNASTKSLQCGHDVTFPEFIQYFIHAQTTGEHRDAHFTPLHEHCQFCDFPYRYIGHLETLSEDLPFILKAINSPVNYTKTFNNSTISNNSNMVFQQMRQGVLQCMTLEEAGRRLWKKWHIRGLISKTELFPLSASLMADISAQDFQGAALRAVARSQDKLALKQQKLDALREAFDVISTEDKLQVQRLLLPDFRLFGFLPSPPAVFPPAPRQETDFSFFSLYD